MTQQDFIKKAVTLYGNKYDYSKVKYVNNKTKVTIICKRCGNIFDIRPNDFLNNHGCKKCRWIFEKKYYIEKFIKKHGDKYDYSLMLSNKLYNKNDIIKIICPKHGCFEQRIQNHLQGKGCPKCGYEKSIKARKLNIDVIRLRLENLCANKLTYNIEEYKNTNAPITFVCNDCGKSFKRDLNSLMLNNSCPYCNGKPRNLKYDTTEFIEAAKKIHEDKYDYSKVIYEKTDKKVCVICHRKDIFGNEHGEFWVTPHAHIGKMHSGCPKCSRKYKKTTEEFIQEASFIHNDFYDYSEVKYVNAKTKVQIICPKHGKFLQTPNCHLNGEGCPICKQSRYEGKIARFLTENNILFIQQYKPEWLKPLSIDFYLPDYKIGIEIQGIQHFSSVKYWGDKNTFDEIKNRDERKRILCHENNIKLLYYSELKIKFPYEVITDMQKLLESIK